MSVSLGKIAFLVRDYDEAIAWFRDCVGFEVIEDTPLDGGKRWVVVAGAGGAALVLAKADGLIQEARIGDQTGGRVGWFLQCDDFAARHQRMIAAGVEFLETPRREAYGHVAVFRDPWGGKWDLLGERDLPETASPGGVA